MKTNNAAFRAFAAALEDTAHDIVRACRRGARTLAAMPWPAMLACCIALAAVISILPLALFLFALLMAVKVVLGAVFVDHCRTGRERRGEGCGEHHGQH